MDLALPPLKVASEQDPSKVNALTTETKKMDFCMTQAPIGEMVVIFPKRL
jgi:hypothetical protein